MSRINIIAPDIWEKDAVGNFCLDLSKLLTENGIKVSLYSQNFSKEETPNINHIDKLFEDLKEDDVIFLSYSIYDKYLEQILALPNKKVCYFHGVTPAHLLEEFEPITAELCRKSVEQFPLLDKFDKVISNSVFIADDLKKYISKEIDVLPPVFPSRFLFNKKIEIVQKNRDFLVVGRVVPHKKVENAIKLFIKIKESIPDANLIIIGSMPNHIYNEFLYDEVKNSNLSNSIQFKGLVSDVELETLYKYSYGFINASLHEGFGVPLLEAIYNDMLILVQSGHALEELLNGNMETIDFNNLDKINIKFFLEKNMIKNSKEYVLKILEKNNSYNWKFFLNNNIEYVCNICETKMNIDKFSLNREVRSCNNCNSTVRSRQILYLLSIVLFDKSLTIKELPLSKEINILGMSDMKVISNSLKDKFNYINTFYDKEPYLDIHNLKEKYIGNFNVIISSDVFEHILSPVQNAFDNLFKLLKNNGVVIFTVPYSLEEKTIEHFENLNKFEIIEEENKKKLISYKENEISEVYDNLIFHEDENGGFTLEMRLFSLTDIIKCFKKAGFARVDVANYNYLPFGIVNCDPWSLPLIAYKNIKN